MERVRLAREIHPDLALMYERELRATGIPVVSVPNDIGGFAPTADLWLEDASVLDDPDTREIIGHVLASSSPPDQVPDELPMVPHEEPAHFGYPASWWILVVAGTIGLGLAIIGLAWVVRALF